LRPRRGEFSACFREAQWPLNRACDVAGCTRVRLCRCDGPCARCGCTVCCVFGVACTRGVVQASWVCLRAVVRCRGFVPTCRSACGHSLLWQFAACQRSASTRAWTFIWRQRRVARCGPAVLAWQVCRVLVSCLRVLRPAAAAGSTARRKRQWSG